MNYDIVSERRGPLVTIRAPEDTMEVLKKYSRKRAEHFIVMTLRADHSVERVRIVSIGLVNRSLVHPREVFTPAIGDNSTAIIVAHNHPSGTLDPSEEDKQVTDRLIKAGELLGIEVLDHIVFGPTGFVSFKDLGLLNRGGR